MRIAFSPISTAALCASTRHDGCFGSQSQGVNTSPSTTNSCGLFRLIPLPVIATTVSPASFSSCGVFAARSTSGATFRFCMNRPPSTVASNELMSTVIASATATNSPETNITWPFAEATFCDWSKEISSARSSTWPLLSTVFPFAVSSCREGS